MAPKKKHNSGDHKMKDDPEVAAEREYAIANGIVKPKATDDLRLETQAPVPKPRDNVRRAFSVSESAVTASTGVVKVPREQKNQRKSRARVARGLPKKGGRFTWGRIGCEVNAPMFLDKDDPNYDDSASDATLEEVDMGPTTVNLVDIVARPVIEELYEDSDIKKEVELLADLHLDEEASAYTIAIMLEKSIDKKQASWRELTSQMFADACAREPPVFKAAEMASGFEWYMEKRFHDMCIDYPNLATWIGNYIARAIADHCFGKSVLDKWSEKYDDEQITAAVKRAKALLAQPHAAYHLHSIWGTMGGMRPTRALSADMNTLILEYIGGGDCESALAELRKLEVPHFHHELVYLLSVRVCELMDGNVNTRCIELLSYLRQHGALSDDCLATGLHRFYDILPNLEIDVPAAYTLASDRWVKQLAVRGVIPPQLANECPQMPAGRRRRFVSETQDGRYRVDDVDE